MGRPTARVLLRLDNGELLGEAHHFGKAGDTSVVRLTVEEAFAAGRLGEKDVERLRRFVNEAARLSANSNLFKEQNGAKLQNGKRVGSADHQAGAPFAPPAKRKKQRGNGSEASLGGSAWQPGMDFREKCLQLCNAMNEFLGKQDAGIFEYPVDALTTPDYYNIVKEPICFQDVRKKLALGAQAGGYAGPQDFYNDVHRIWANCALYNHKHSYVGKLGHRAEAKFEELWAGSGFDSGRHRRATAGIAAAKFEPNETVSEKKPKKYDSFKRSGKKLQSYKTQEQYQQMPAMKKMEELAEFLGTLEPDGPELRGAFLSQPTSDADLHYSNVTNEHDGLMISENLRVVAILHEMEPHLSTENELELSFDDMSPGTIWRLLDHMRELQRVNENGALRPVDSDPDTEDSDA